MSANEADLVIWGMTLAGRPFRPSDWAERLAGLVSVFGDDQRLAYSPYVRPVTVAGLRAVVVGGDLATLEPRLFDFMVGFARDNDLQHAEVVGALAAPHDLLPPRVREMGEPREPV